MARIPPVKLKNGCQPVILSVLAHPDDETFGMGGTLALYARRGVKVYLVCATRGEVGEMDPALMRGFNSVGGRREAELRCAAEKLGLAGVFFLGYRDSGMPGSPDNTHPQALTFQTVEQVAREVAHLIRQLKPQLVLTFDPIGGYRHPDHIAIHNATVRAFTLAGQPDGFDDPEGLPPYQPERLYFHTIGRGFLRAAVFFLRLFGQDPTKFGKNHDINLAALAEVTFPIHAVIDFSPVAKIRDEAAACHASQGGGAMSSGIQGAVRLVFGGTGESFMRAAPPVLNGEHKTHDLFAGL